MMTAPRGQLAPFLNATEQGRKLRDQGWLKVVLDHDKCMQLRSRFKQDLRDEGFDGNLDAKDKRQGNSFPHGMSGIDVCILPFKETAMDARLMMLEAFADIYGVAADVLVSSFDGVMCAPSGRRWSGTPYFNPLIPRVPSAFVDGKWVGAHIDQNLSNADDATCYQAFLCLCDADAITQSTVLMVPTEGHTLQSISDALRVQFADWFASANARGEGYTVPLEFQDWLVAQGMAKAIKPRLRVGEMLIWSSLMIHVGGVQKPPRGQTGNPRLGIISSFCPLELVSTGAQWFRHECVSEQVRCTGQGITIPIKHMLWPPCFRWKKIESGPPAFVRHENKRRRLREAGIGLLDETDPETAPYRAKVLRLLGPK